MLATLKPTRKKKHARRRRGSGSAIALAVDRYIEGVLNGKIIAGELVRLAVKRHLVDLQTGRRRGLRFSEVKAERAIRFFGLLRHSKGEWAGQAFSLQPWQMFIVWVVFGWLKADGTRRFSTVYLEVARKNGKSTFISGIGLLLAFADEEPGAEVYSAATKKDQALIVHGEAVRMVKASPDLLNCIEVYKNNLSRVEKHQKFVPISADEDTLDGLNMHGGLVDELHAHKNRGVWDVLDTARGARRQSLLVGITTAGTDQTDASICWEQHVYAEQILTGVIEDDRYFGFICAMDEKKDPKTGQIVVDDWQNERNWYKANPNLGVSKYLDYMRAQAKKAAQLPGFLNTFLRLELNRWTQQVVRWISLEIWDANAGAPIDVESLRGRLCYGGLDLSSVSDLTAWVLVFPDPADPLDRVDVVARIFCPEDRLHNEQNKYRDQYQVWARDGFLTPTPGNAIDYERVRAQIVEDAGRFQLKEVAVDRLFQGYQLSMQLAEDDGLTVAACGMGFMSMAAPMQELERRLLVKKIHHGGNPVLRWMANNVAVKQDAAGNRKPDKKSSQGKIDGIVALLLALDRHMRHRDERSIYETRGMTEVGGASS